MSAPDLLGQVRASLSAASTATDVTLRGVYVATARAVLVGLEDDVRRARAHVEGAERELVRLAGGSP